MPNDLKWNMFFLFILKILKKYLLFFFKFWKMKIKNSFSVYIKNNAFWLHWRYKRPSRNCLENTLKAVPRSFVPSLFYNGLGSRSSGRPWSSGRPCSSRWLRSSGWSPRFPQNDGLKNTIKINRNQMNYDLPFRSTNLVDDRVNEVLVVLNVAEQSVEVGDTPQSLRRGGDHSLQVISLVIVLCLWN